MSLRDSLKNWKGRLGWAAVISGPLLRVLELAHLAEWLYHKLEWLGPLMPPVTAVLSSLWFQIALTLVGLLLIWLASRPGDPLTVLRNEGRT